MPTALDSQLALPIPEQHPCYAAHFPDAPIVPGALLLTWIFELLREQHPLINVSGIRTVKFLTVVKPGDDCQLNVTENATPNRLQIKLSCNGKPALKGTIDTQPNKNTQLIPS